MTAKMRIAIVFSHPVQYFVPLFRMLAKEPDVELKLFFATEVGIRPVVDPGFGVPVVWSIPLTEGYEHEFLPRAGEIDSVGFWQVRNPGVGRALAAFRPDAVILHGYALVTMLKGLAWCTLHRVPALMIADSSADQVPPGVRRWVKYRIIPRLLARYSGLLLWGERSEDHFAGFGYPRERLHRVPNMMDESFWAARKARAEIRAEIRAELGIGADAFVVMTSGKLQPHKRVADAVEALARPAVAAASRRTVLMVAGDGAERGALEALAAARGVDVRFLGFVNLDRLPRIYAAADALVHASEFEPFGVVMSEAAALGLPLIVSDKVGAVGRTAIARPDENTLLYPCGDVDALAAVIARFRDDEDLRARFAAVSDRISSDHDGRTSVATVKRAVRQALGH